MFGADDVYVSVDEVEPTTNDSQYQQQVLLVTKLLTLIYHLPFHGSVLSAVNSDMKEWETRCENFPVSGLPVSTDDEDKTVMETLCEKSCTLRHQQLHTAGEKHSTETAKQSLYQFVPKNKLPALCRVHRIYESLKTLSSGRMFTPIQI